MAEAEAQKAAATAPAEGGANRRDFLASFPFVTTAWVAITGALAGVGAASLRFLYPNVLYEPPQQFKVGFPTDFQVGEVSIGFKDRFGIWVIRNDEGFYALITVCTHLGCTPNWLATENKFKCPCHGSGFRGIDPGKPYPGIAGINFEGPAPRPLERFKIGLAEDGQILIDMGTLFRSELEQWENPDSFLKYAG